MSKLQSGSDRLTTVHLMPQNLCNHRCSFCSYRMPDNKNSMAFDEGQHIPWPAMAELLQHFKDLDVKGVEVTGGGEPLAYPHFDRMLQLLVYHDFAIGLVTNGTLFGKWREEFSKLGDALRWVRISIDAGNTNTYAKTRKVAGSHMLRAWDMLSTLGTARAAGIFHRDFELGAGFVLSNENLGEIRQFVEKAKRYGATNVRLSSTFSDKNLDYFEDLEAVQRAVDDSIAAEEEFTDEDFKVHNMIPSRIWETEHPTQDYGPCFTKDLLCVVEGAGNVYSCCTFTGSDRGLWGNIHTHPGGFKGVWEDAAARRQGWDSRKECQCSCLYREKNLAMIDIVSGDLPEAVHHKHAEFL